MRTNHAAEIEFLRADGATLEDRLAADLLEIHDATGISLDRWDTARTFVEQRIGQPITENGV